MSEHYEKVKLVYRTMVELNVTTEQLMAHCLVIDALSLEKMMSHTLEECVDFASDQRVACHDETDKTVYDQAVIFASTIKPLVKCEEWADHVYAMDITLSFLTLARTMNFDGPDKAAEWVLDRVRPHVCPPMPESVEDVLLSKLDAALQ